MSDCDNNELEEKLVELNNWQIEQRKKLKEFQEAQRKLLDSEHEKILSSLKTPNFEKRHAFEENHSSCLFDMSGVESDLEIQRKSCSPHFAFNFRSRGIKLKDPRVNLHSLPKFSQCEDEELIKNCEDNEERETSKPKRFLKKGEGLARFRMTFDDFKSPPNIYREKRIKTYLNQKPDLSKKKTSKHVKSANEVCRKRKPFHPCNKSRTVPVNIFVAENKQKDVGSAKSTSEPKDNKVTCVPRNKDIQLSKVPMKSLTLKPLPSLRCTKNSLQEENNAGVLFDKPKEICRSPEINLIEKQMKKDEKELRMFEMLEGKIGDGSLSPNSSLVARFMEESLCSTPSKQLVSDQEQDKCYSYLESLRALQRRYLTLEQIEKVEELGEQCLSDGMQNENSMRDRDKISDTVTDNLTGLELDINADDYNSNENKEEEEDFTEPEDINQNKDKERDLSQEIEREFVPLLQQPFEANKTLLQEYIENFKKFKSEVKESCRSDSEDIDELVVGEKPTEVINHQVPSQREIAIKLQRKALQDNVKNILNWEAVPRKKSSKKLLKKVRGKPVKTDKLKKTEKREDKVIFDNALLNDRLQELEKEIEIFKRENKSLTQLQRECEVEKSRLEKEKREFEKYKEQEREKLEARINEEQRKLQRDKNVFDKYCKQMKNQPNKKEREEITNLKKEVERLTEAMATKDARLGASQARLRNQIKMLEKENTELKSELEKLKKQTLKKVSFENEKSINTKIIHTINYELGKLKPFTVKKGSAKQKYQSLTARVDTNLPKKPMRRTKSVPDLKKSSDKAALSDCDEILSPGFLEKDQPNFSCYGIKVNNSEDLPKGIYNSNPFPEKFADFTDTNPEITQLSLSCGYETKNNDIKEHVTKTKTLREDSSKDIIENVLHETFFDLRDRGDHNGASETISEIKRRLENLNFLHHSESFSGTGEGDKNRCDFTRSHTINCVSDESSASNEEDEEDKENNYLDFEQSEYVTKTSACLNYPCQTKVDHNGIREKTYDDGRKEIIYPNGNVKKISADARIVKMIYYNGDVKETDVSEGSEKYFYAETKTWHTTYKDGLEVLEFPNGQTERRHPDGSTEILFPNGCIRYCDSSGKDEWRFLDGTVIKTDKKGHKVLLLPNGQKEIHTKEYKRREYPDGTIKLLYSDGTQETRYASGRVRLKDKDGNLVMDSGGIREKQLILPTNRLFPEELNSKDWSEQFCRSKKPFASAYPSLSFVFPKNQSTVREEVLILRSV